MYKKKSYDDDARASWHRRHDARDDAALSDVIARRPRARVMKRTNSARHRASPVIRVSRAFGRGGKDAVARDAPRTRIRARLADPRLDVDVARDCASERLTRRDERPCCSTPSTRRVSMMALIAMASLTRDARARANASGASETSEFYIDNVPNALSANEGDGTKRRSLTSLVRGVDGPRVEACANACVTTCRRSGENANASGSSDRERERGEKFVFQSGFRSREYCLTTCTEECAKRVAMRR